MRLFVLCYKLGALKSHPILYTEFDMRVDIELHTRLGLPEVVRLLSRYHKQAFNIGDRLSVDGDEYILVNTNYDGPKLQFFGFKDEEAWKREYPNLNL